MAKIWTMKSRFNRFLLIVNWQTLIISLLAVTSTALCIEYKFEADFPFNLIAMSVVFPIVFSIGGAYKRREDALKGYAEVKGYLRAIYFVSRDWLENPKPENVDKMKGLVHEVLNNIRTSFTQSKEDLKENEKRIYKNFSEISLSLSMI